MRTRALIRVGKGVMVFRSVLESPLPLRLTRGDRPGSLPWFFFSGPF